MTVRLCRVQSRCSVCSVEKFFSRTFNAVGFFHWSCAKRLTSVSSPCVLWTVKPQECAALSRFTSHPAPLFQFSEKCDAVNSEKKNKPGQVFCEWDFFSPPPSPSHFFVNEKQLESPARNLSPLETTTIGCCAPDPASFVSARSCGWPRGGV